MRPADLKSPFILKERSHLIEDRIFYVPFLKTPVPFSFPGWSAPDIFGNDAPVHVEYCSGNGDWIAAKALENPHCNWVAVEKKFDRVRKIWSKMKNAALDNLFIICGEGQMATREYIADASVANAYINFPDPWPKKRHWKNRLIQQSFLVELNRVLGAQGTITFVTDDPNYSEQLIKEMHRSSLYTPTFPAPFYHTVLPDYGNSYFERLWRSQAKEIRYHIFRKLFSGG